MITPGTIDYTPYSHYSLLRTISLNWDLGVFGQEADEGVFPFALNTTDIANGTLVVPAVSYPGVTSKVNLASDQTVVITATGEWTVGRISGNHGPDGTQSSTSRKSCAVLPAARIGALIGTLNGWEWFEIGSGPTTVTGPGVLRFLANECPGYPVGSSYSDNSGELRVNMLDLKPAAHVEPPKPNTINVEADPSADEQPAHFPLFIFGGVGLSAVILAILVLLILLHPLRQSSPQVDIPLESVKEDQSETTGGDSDVELLTDNPGYTQVCHFG